VVKEVKARHRSRLVLQEVTDLEPCGCGTVCVRTRLLKLLLIELLAGDLLQLLDCRIELRAHILDLGIIDLDIVVVRNVDHDERNVVNAGNVLVPLRHAVANVIAAEDKVGHRHQVLTDRLQRL
jgi:hypothetical protein